MTIKKEDILVDSKYIDLLEEESIDNYNIENKSKYNYNPKDYEEQEKEYQLLFEELDYIMENSCYEENVELFNNLNRYIRIFINQYSERKKNVSIDDKHTGYILLFSKEHLDVHYNKYSWYWRSRFRTPWPISLGLETVQFLIKTYFMTEVAPHLGIQNNSKYKKPLEKITNSDVFNLCYRINGTKGYWEIEFSTENPIVIIPGILSPKLSDL